MSEVRAIRLRVHGLVQGVGFRESLRWEAEQRGVVGWVRNRSDGTVEAVVQGQPAAVDAVVDWARRGPRSARVERLEAADEEASDFAAFERKPTL